MANGDLGWIANFIWGIADDVLRDLYVRGKYRDVILPMTVLRRLDGVLEPKKQAVLDMKASLDKAGIANPDLALRQAAGQDFYNTSNFTLRDLRARANQQQLKADFEDYLDGFSPNVQEILDSFELPNTARIPSSSFSLKPSVRTNGKIFWRQRMSWHIWKTRPIPEHGTIAFYAIGHSMTHLARLIHRFWVFLASEARQAAEAAKQKLAASALALSTLQLNFFSRDTKAHAHLTRLNPALARRVETAVAALERDRAHLIEILGHGTGSIDAVAPADFSTALSSPLEQINSDIVRLREKNVEDALKALEAERVILRHRQVLSQLFPEIETFLADQAWVQSASGVPKRSLSPRPLTDKESELFGTIIVKGYRSRFADECRKLSCDLPIELRTKGDRGQTVRSLSMKGGHSPDKILSEGEQRAVALADFLTEINLNPANAGIVLDDPVTSQDHQRKERIARRLVAEAKIRQVIVFTHDLVFLTMLAGAAADDSIPILTHWVERDAEGRPGQVSLDDCPATTPQYRNTQKAQNTLAAAQKAVGSARLQQLIQRGMAELRRTLEEIVPHFLFKQIVNRWTDRVIVTKLGEVNWDSNLAREIATTFEELSAYIEGHSHTEERAGAPANPKDLEERIVRVNDIIKRARK